MAKAVATLICVYEGDDPALFHSALSSILEQVLPAGLESRIYLGIDGPIPEPLRQVVDEYASHLHVIRQSGRNQGLARTLNVLIRDLQDEAFVFRMDADDVSLPDRYASQIVYLRGHPDIDVLGTAIIEVDAVTGVERLVRFCSGPADARANIHRRVPVAHPTVCFRRRVLDAVGGYPVVGTNEDIALWFECLRRGFAFDNLREPLLRFRLSPGFWRRRSFAKARSEVLCYLRGIYSLDGLFTTKYFFPLLRLAVRLAPTSIAKWAYQSSFRRTRGDDAKTAGRAG